MDPAGDVVRLVELRQAPLEVGEVLAAVGDDAAGATTFFVGVVRNHDTPIGTGPGGTGTHEPPPRDSQPDHRVEYLEYTAHPTAARRLREVAEQVAARHSVTGVAAVHRVGHLAVGDLAVVVAAAAVHRGEAFEAARDLIDTLKAEVPIWKHQVFTDGREEWVGSP